MKPSSRRAVAVAVAFLLAVLGCRPTGQVPEDPAVPYRQAFERLGGTPTGARDACLSCHQGAYDPAFALKGREFLDPRVENAASAAFPDLVERTRFRRVLREHPKPDLLAGPRSPHAGIGCAECHVTSDRRDELNADRAAEWEKYHTSRHPVLPEVTLRPLHRTEAACLRCHLGQDPLPGAELLNRGRMLYYRAACHACHVTPSMKTREEDLVDGERRVPKPGPPLTSIADKVDKAWANAWLYHPAHFRPTTRMPFFFPRGDLNLPPQLASAVPPDQLERYERVLVACAVEYLFERSKPSGLPDAPPDILETVDWKIEDQRERGERLVMDLGCLACHRLDENYGSEGQKDRSYLEEEFAPNLFGSGDKFDSPLGRRWLYHWLRNPSRWFPGTTMPRFDLTDAQIGDIIQFLLSLKIDNEASRAKGFTPWEPREPDIDGKILDELARHQGAPAASTEREKILYVGRKTVETFGCYACHSMGGEWDRLPVLEGPLTRDLLPVRGVMERMPLSYIKPDDMNAIVTYLWAHHDAIGAPYRASARDEGARVFEKYNCAGCHVAEEVRVFVRDNGRVVGADIRYKDRLGDPPRWSIEWLREPRTLEVPMIAAHHPQLLEAAVERHTPARGGTFAARRIAAAAPEEIDALAYQMPPSLRTSGRKFRPEWLRRFLERPFAIRPEHALRMPAFDFEEGEVEALVAYLRERDGARSEDAGGRLTPVEIGARWERLLAADRRLRKDCTACHLVDGSGRDLSVDLGRLHERIQRPWLRAFLEDPAGIYPRTAMPSFEWGPGELDDMVDLLLNFDRVRAAKVERGKPEEIIEALASGDPALAQQALERAAGGDPEMVEVALRALKIFRDRRSGPRGTIEAVLAHPAPPVRRAAVATLSATGAPLDAAEKLLSDPDLGVRRAAVEALSSSRDPRFARAIAGRLRDEHAAVRELALRALALMNARGEAAAVTEATRDRDPLLRRAAIDVLEHLGAEEQADAVAEALRDPETAVRVRAAEALGALGEVRHIEALSAAAREDGSPVVRTAAHLAIARLGGAPITQSLEDPVPAVRAAASVGLLRAGNPQGRAALADLVRVRPRDTDLDRALAVCVSLLEEGGPKVEPGRRSINEWVERLGAFAPAGGSRAAVTLRSGEAAEWRIAIPLASGLAFVRREGKLALVPLEEAIEEILEDDR